MLAVIVLITGGVVDYVSLSLQEKDVRHVADKAALTAAHELVLSSDSKSHPVLNIDYGLTRVPVPNGLGNRAVDIRLAR